MINIVICDDEATARNTLCDYIDRFSKETGESFHITQFKNGEDLLHGYPVHCDIILIDIIMDMLNGIETAARIRRMDRDVCIIFITQTPQYALNAYKVHALGYLTKPLAYNDLRYELNEALRRINFNKDEYIVLKSQSETTKVNIRDILYIEAQNHKLLVVSSDGTERQCYGKLSDIEQQLENKQFFRCHRAYLLNLRWLSRIDGNNALLSGGCSVPISKYRRNELMQALTDHLGKQL